MTPFFNPKEVMARVESYIAELDVTTLESHGFSKFELPEENLKGTVTLKWLGVPFPGKQPEQPAIGVNNKPFRNRMRSLFSWIQGEHY